LVFTQIIEAANYKLKLAEIKLPTIIRFSITHYTNKTVNSKIAVPAGDGIGPEVILQAKKKKSVIRWCCLSS
jgi:hypothetical protein